MERERREEKGSNMHVHAHIRSLVPRLFPCRKTGREPGRTDHVPRDVLCVVLCVVLIIELLPTQSVLRVRCWSSGSMDIAETTDGHWKAVSLLFNSLVSSVASTVHLVPLKHP